MLHRFDDYPIHQSSQPLLHVETPSADAYDRYSFNGHRADGSLLFAATLAVYPNRDVIDAALALSVDGVQVSTLASGRAPLDRTRTRVGPLRVDVIEPMRILRVRCLDGPLQADLTFRARTAAAAWPRRTLIEAATTVIDETQMTQWGSWDGEIVLDGRRFDVDSMPGSRERSWGVTPLPRHDAAPPRQAPQRFSLSASLNFEDCAVRFAVEEHSDGRRWHHVGALVPLLLDDIAVAVPDEPDAAQAAVEAADDALLAPPIAMRGADYVVDWEPGTRRAAMASIILEPYASLDTHIIRLEPRAVVHLKGLGYGHTERSHGRWHGETDTVTWRWTSGELDPAAPEDLHIQQAVVARWAGRTGIGVLETLAIGNHSPTGLSGLYDGAE